MKITNRKKKKAKAARFEIITVLPEALKSYFNLSIMGRAQAKGLMAVCWHDLRQYGLGKRRTVDDAPFGGGPGMVLMYPPIEKAVAKIAGRGEKRGKRTRVILLSTRGKVFDKGAAARLARQYDKIVIIAGRYEGVDERVRKIADEEISVGNFILAGGELAAAMVVETVARFIPGVLGKDESLEENKGSYPVYTRPAEVKMDRRRLKVPAALMSGNHKEIEKWRREKGRRKEEEVGREEKAG